MTPFVRRIRAQLDAIPHDANDCAAISMDGMPPLGPCDCSRDQRIAEAVARAIRATAFAAIESIYPERMGNHDEYVYDAALRALSFPEQEST